MSTEADIVEIAAKAMRACVLHEACTQELRDLDWERIGEAREIYRREARAAITATTPTIRDAAARDMRERCAVIANDRWREWRMSDSDDLDGMDACKDIAKAIRATALLATDGECS